MTAARIGLSVSAEEVACAIDAMDDYRVLRRMVPLARRADRPMKDVFVHGLALDVETTGLDHRRHRVIELAMQRFVADRDGVIVDIGRCRRWLEDPGEPLGEEIRGLTGLTDQELAGRSICDAEATSILMDVDFVVAHNARFDRPFVEARLPQGAGRPWVCSMSDVAWREHGFEGRVLSGLLMQMGRFYDAHRADVDVAALIHLLDHRLSRTGATVLGEAVTRASRPTWIVEAVRAPFAAKDALKERGYRWNADAKVWSREVADDGIDDEIAWATARVYGGGAKPRFRRTDWTARYAATA